MATGSERMRIEGTTQVLAGEDVELLQEHGREEQHALQQSLLRSDTVPSLDSAFALGGPETVLVGNPGGPTALFSVQGATLTKLRAAYMARGDTAWSQLVLSGELATWDSASTGFTLVPYDVNGTSSYLVALRNWDCPARATQRTDGSYRWDRWVHGVGERRQSFIVTEPVPGAGLRIYLATAAGSIVATWSDPTKTRPVRCWYSTDGTPVGPPVTASSEAYYDGLLESDGVSVWVDVPHYFGQPPASWDSTASRYLVHVHGLTVTDRAVVDTTLTLEWGVRRYHVLAEFDSATLLVDHTEQQVVPTLQDVATQVAGLTDLTRALRAGCQIGDVEVTEAWNDAANVVVAVGANVTFTYNDPLTWQPAKQARTYVFAGTISATHSEPRVMTALSAGGHVASMSAAAAPAAFYEIFFERDAPFHTARLSIGPPATVIGDAARRVLPVASFDWNGAAVSNYTPIDLNTYRGIANGSLVGPGDETGSPDGGHLAVRDVAAFWDSATSEAQVVFHARRPSAPAETFAKRSLLLSGPNEVAIDDLAPRYPADLTATHRARRRYGGPNDYDVEAVGAAAHVDRILHCTAGGTSAWVHRRGGGLGVFNAHRLQVADLHLLWSKDVWFGANMTGATPRDSTWEYQTGFGADPGYGGWVKRVVAANIKEVWYGAWWNVQGTPGAWALQEITSNADGGLTFQIPFDFVSTVELRLAGYPSAGAAGAGKSIDLAAEFGQIGWVRNFHINVFNSVYAIPAVDTLFEINLVPLLPDSGVPPPQIITAGDHVGVYVDHNLIGGSIFYLGIRHRYVAAEPATLATEDLEIDLGPLPLGAKLATTLGHTIRDVRVFCGVDGVNPTDGVFLQLIDYNTTTHAQVAVPGASGTLSNSPSGAWVSLSPTTPVSVQRDHRYLVRAVTANPNGTSTYWFVRNVEYQVRINQVT